MKVQQVLNLVRAEADRLIETGALVVVKPANECDIKKAVKVMAHMTLRASSATPEDLAAVSDAAMRCASRRQVGVHCGACQEYDKALDGLNYAAGGLA